MATFFVAGALKLEPQQTLPAPPRSCTVTVALCDSGSVGAARFVPSALSVMLGFPATPALRPIPWMPSGLVLLLYLKPVLDSFQHGLPEQTPPKGTCAWRTRAGVAFRLGCVDASDLTRELDCRAWAAAVGQRIPS